MKLPPPPLVPQCVGVPTGKILVNITNYSSTNYCVVNLWENDKLLTGGNVPPKAGGE